MPKKERNYENTVLSLRLTSAEAVRFWKVMDDAKSRNAYAGRSGVIRELFGLNAPDALTQDEIKFFRGYLMKAMPRGARVIDAPLADEPRKRKAR